MPSTCIDSRNHPAQFDVAKSLLKTTRDTTPPPDQKRVSEKICLVEPNGLPTLVREFDVYEGDNGNSYDSPKAYHIVTKDNTQAAALDPYTWLPYQDAGVLEMPENSEALKDKDIVKPITQEKLDLIKKLISSEINPIGFSRTLLGPLAAAARDRFSSSLSPILQPNELSEALTILVKRSVILGEIKQYVGETKDTVVDGLKHYLGVTCVDEKAKNKAQDQVKDAAMGQYMKGLRAVIHTETLMEKMAPSLSAAAADKFKTHLGQTLKEARGVAIHSLQHFLEVTSS